MSLRFDDARSSISERQGARPCERAAASEGVRCRPSQSSPNPARIPEACRIASARSLPTILVPKISGACTGSTTPTGRRRVDVPGHVVLPQALTGVEAPIVVLARAPLSDDRRAQGAGGLCLPGAAPRRPAGSIRHRPQGGVAVDRQLLPRRRRDLAHPRLPRRRRAARRHEPRALRLAGALGARTGATSSARRAPRATSRKSTTSAPSCRAIRENVILNQFSEFAQLSDSLSLHGRGARRVFVAPASRRTRERAPCGFVSATGSAGTIAAGDYLKARHGTKIAAVEAIECPTMLSNGYGEHNIQGIGDKHIPLIHNVMNTDLVDRRLRQRERRAQPAVQRQCRPRLSGCGGARSIPRWCDQFDNIGISGLANIVAAIKIAKHFELGADDVVMTVATDSAEMYAQRAPELSRAGAIRAASTR